MAVQIQEKMTVEAFDAWIIDQDEMYEYIAGEVSEVPSNPKVSNIAAIISGELYIYLRGNDLGYLTGEAGGFMVGGSRYAPDVAFISYARQPALEEKGYNPNPSELAVEVISDVQNMEEARQLRIKVTGYLSVGTLVWVVNPVEKLVEVYEPGKIGYVIGEDDTLTAESIMPGFALPVKSIFKTHPA